jgi:phage-related protein (TIGR01555 family)
MRPIGKMHLNRRATAAQGPAIRPMKIGAKAIARAEAMLAKAAPRKPEPFRLDMARFHPPGVLPTGKTLAMDNAITGPNSWAGASWAAAATQNAFFEGQEFLGYPYLAVLAQRPEYRALVEVVATESTRRGWKIQAATTESDKDQRDDGEQREGGKPKNSGDKDKTGKIKELTDYLDHLRVKDHMKASSALDGYFGRGHLYIDTGATDDRAELLKPIGNGRDDVSKLKVGRGTNLRLQSVEPVWCYPNTYNSSDPLKPDWYCPQTWFAMGKEIHRTRFLTFISEPVPDLLKPAYSFGGLAATQLAKPYVDNWLKIRQACADIVQAFSIMVLSTDLSATLTGDGDEMYKRALLFNAARQNAMLMMINKDTEAFENVAAPLGTLDQLQAQAQEHMASCRRIPVVKLFGIQPAGLNADSEGIIRAFYDTMGSYQESFYRPHLTTIVDFAQLSLWGEVDDALTIVFEPLWTLDEKGQAEVRKIEAETDVILTDGGILHPEEPRKRLAGDPDTPYQGLDVDDVPEPPVDPEMGGESDEPGVHPTKIKSSINVAGGDEGLAADSFAFAIDADGKPVYAFDEAPKGRRGRPPKSKRAVVVDMFANGTTTPELLKATGWPSISIPHIAKAVGMVLTEITQDGVVKYKGVVDEQKAA